MPTANYNPVSPYGYTPNPWVGVMFIALFAASGMLHMYQAWKHKYWIVYPTLVVGALLEVVGWTGRFWSSQNVLYNPPFLQQIIALIIAPVFFSAWLYTLLGMAIRTLGSQFSFLRSKLYIIIFVSCDFISLLLQAFGGGWAASSPSPIPKLATNIMEIGIIFQLGSMIIFSVLTLDFVVRCRLGKGYRRDDDIEMSPSGGKSAGSEIDRQLLSGWMRLLLGTAICSLMIIIRGVYRSIELMQGWEGYLITHEVYTIWFDGAVMVVALVTVNVFHPGFFLPDRQGWRRA